MQFLRKRHNYAMVTTASMSFKGSPSPFVGEDTEARVD